MSGRQDILNQALSYVRDFRLRQKFHNVMLLDTNFGFTLQDGTHQQGVLILNYRVWRLKVLS